MPSFPDSALPAVIIPPPSYTEAAPTPRYYGGINMNDRINTFWRKHEPASTRVIVIETPADVDGNSVVTRIDRKARDIVLYILYKETAGNTFELFQETMENLINVDLTTGDGLKYQHVYTVDCSAQLNQVYDHTTQPPLRYMEITIKVTALNPHRVAA